MKRANGFTLLELMIVVLVIAILAGLALSGYQNQVRKSRRAEAKQALSDTVLREEKWRANHAKYLGTDSVTGDVSLFGALATSNYYTLSITTVESGTDYTAAAVPKSGTDQTKDSCGTLRVQMVSGVLYKCPGAATVCAAQTPTDCW